MPIPKETAIMASDTPKQTAIRLMNVVRDAIGSDLCSNIGRTLQPNQPTEKESCGFRPIARSSPRHAVIKFTGGDRQAPSGSNCTKNHYAIFRHGCKSAGVCGT